MTNIPNPPPSSPVGEKKCLDQIIYTHQNTFLCWIAQIKSISMTQRVLQGELIKASKQHLLQGELLSMGVEF